MKRRLLSNQSSQTSASRTFFDAKSSQKTTWLAYLWIKLQVYSYIKCHHGFFCSSFFSYLLLDQFEVKRPPSFTVGHRPRSALSLPTARVHIQYVLNLRFACQKILKIFQSNFLFVARKILRNLTCAALHSRSLASLRFSNLHCSRLYLSLSVNLGVFTRESKAICCSVCLSKCRWRNGIQIWKATSLKQTIAIVALCNRNSTLRLRRGAEWIK